MGDESEREVSGTVGGPLSRAATLVVVGLFGLIAAGVGWLLFVTAPAGNLARLLGVVLVVVTAVTAVRAGSRLASRLFPGYNVAEVAVDGPITRDGGGRLPTSPRSLPADDVVDQIEAADEDRHVEALVVRLNTPGGEVVPSDDIRLAVERFDGPTVAYATDTCASGGYWIATACDRIVAREGSVVGSIGVIGSVVTAADLLERVGVSYERLAAGDYKDAGTALREMTAEERDYLQSLVDGYYEAFVDRVSEGRDLDPEVVRDTEARVYLGPEARDRGLVDAIGTREDVEDDLERELGEPVEVAEFEPSHGLVERIRGGTRSVAYAAGAGAADTLLEADDASLDRLRFR